MRVELNEMEQSNVAGGKFNFTVFRRDMNVKAEHALMDSTKKVILLPVGKQKRTAVTVTTTYC